MDKIKEFHEERKRDIEEMANDQDVIKATDNWIYSVSKYNYAYNMTWMGVPILQLSTEIVALQELIWRIKPDLIIETGLAYGGSIIFSASMLELLGGDGEVIGIDIDVRPHNRSAIESHPMFKRITLIEGSSIDESVISIIRQKVQGKNSVLVILDSNHTHDHVYEELVAYAPFVTLNSYIIVMDTNIEFNYDKISQGKSERPWGVGNNPWTASKQFLEEYDNFEVDSSITDKIVLTCAPDGYLKKIK